MITAAIGVVFLGAALPPAGPPDAHGVVHTSDVDIAYDVYGTVTDTVPLIAVNGGPGLSHVYMTQNDVWPRVGATRRVVLYDQRGTGGSTRVRAGAPQTMAAQVADLDAVRAHLGFAKIDMLGDSYGGMIAMAYTAAHPDRVHKLILSDSAAPSWKTLDHLFPDVFPDMQPAKGEDPLRYHFKMLFYSEAKRDAYLAGAKDLGYAPKTGDAVFKAIANIDLWPQLKRFHVPTLVITGRYDMNVAPLTAWKIAKAIPGARFVAFPQSGHLPAYEEPDRYVRVVEDFLND
jgi:proline iminopeptidase